MFKVLYRICFQVGYDVLVNDEMAEWIGLWLSRYKRYLAKRVNIKNKVNFKKH